MAKARRRPGEARDPAFLWYVTAWLQSITVRAMSLEQRGAYADLLSYAWLHNGIPSDLDEVRDLLAVSHETFDRIWSRVGRCWSPAKDDASRLVNERQEHERKTRARKAQEMRARGAAGGKQRASRAQAEGQAELKQGHKQTGKQTPKQSASRGQAEGQAELKPSTSTSTSTEKEGSKEGFSGSQEQKGEGVRSRTAEAAGDLAAAVVAEVVRAR